MILSSQRVITLGMFGVLFLGLVSSLPAAHAQGGTPNPFICYSVADQDQGLPGPGNDRLVMMDRTTGAFTDLGSLGTNSVEAIAISLSGETLYAAEDAGTAGLFGTVNLDPGAGPLGQFTQIGTFGTGSNAALGNYTFIDVDSLDFDARTGKLWGVTQAANNNVIFQINPATGQFVPDVFGPGYDYALVDLTGVSGAPEDIDDLGIDPITGAFYVVSSGGGTAIADWIVRVNINGTTPAASPGFNPTTGRISTTPIVSITNATNGSFVSDVEGLGAFNDGTFYAVTGEISNFPDILWQVNVTTGVMTPIGTFALYTDYESVGCRTAGSNIKSGTVFLDTNGSGTFDEPPDTRLPNITVRFYLDINNNDAVDSGVDQLLQEQSSDANGDYVFEVARSGTFVVEVDLTDPDLPAGVTPTTGGFQGVDFLPVGGVPFSEYGQTHPDNDFGFGSGVVNTATPVNTPPVNTPPPGRTPVPIPPPGTFTVSDPVIGKLADPPFALPGDQVVWRITVTNPGTTAVTQVVVTDTLPNEVEIVGVASSSGSVTFSGQVVNFSQATLGPGETVTITVTTRVRTTAVPPYVIRNLAVLTNAENPNPRTAQATVSSAASLPATGESRRQVWRTPLLVVAVLIALLLAVVGRRRVRA